MIRELLAFVSMLIIWLVVIDITQRGDVYLGVPPLSKIAKGKMISRQEASPLFFVDEKTGWILHKGGLYGTTDGGGSWNILNIRDARRITKVYFLNRMDGWAIYDSWITQRRSNYVLITRDGGRSWRKVREVSTPIYTIFFLNDYVGYFTPRWEPIQRTLDRGRRWKEINGPEGLNYVFLVNEKKGYGYGASIWHTDDGGQNWVEDTPNEDISDLYGAKILSEQTGWIVGSEGQVWNKAGGKGWRRIKNLPAVGKKNLWNRFR